MWKNEKYRKECNNKIFKKISVINNSKILEKKSPTPQSPRPNSEASIYEQPEQFCHFPPLPMELTYSCSR